MNLARPPQSAYANILYLARTGLRQRHYTDEFRQTLSGWRPESTVEHLYGRTDYAMAGMINTDVAFLLPDDFLTKVDRASMAVGLEVRPPFDDHELLELATRVPSQWKIQKGQTKWMLKQLFDQRLPSNVVWRRKQGFEIPVDDWLRGPLRDLIEETVMGPSNPISMYLNQSQLSRLYQSHGTAWSCSLGRISSRGMDRKVSNDLRLDDGQTAGHS